MYTLMEWLIAVSLAAVSPVANSCSASIFDVIKFNKTYNNELGSAKWVDKS